MYISWVPNILKRDPYAYWYWFSSRKRTEQRSSETFSLNRHKSSYYYRVTVSLKRQSWWPQLVTPRQLPRLLHSVSSRSNHSFFECSLFRYRRSPTLGNMISHNLFLFHPLQGHRHRRIFSDNIVICATPSKDLRAKAYCRMSRIMHKKERIPQHQATAMPDTYRVGS